jgi:hypothetical protein
MTFFTSINNFYLAKARVLAKSVKKHIPEAPFILILSDKIPPNFSLDEEPFDEVITVDQLSIPVDNINLWIFTHSIVELCTAVKGQALYNLLEKNDKVVYLDPDIAVFDDLNILDNLLDQYDIVFTPHQTVPEENDRDIISNEICSLQHGTYNFGFFAVRSNVNGKSYAKWYRDRLVKYCIDDKLNGLFTDQRWGDIAPALFENLYIWKHPGANISTWNLTHRSVSKQDAKYYVNGEPLLFYHFSGFDSGAQLNALEIFANGNPVLYELRDWYINEINKNGQQESENKRCFYNLYSDGSYVEKEDRILFRNRWDLQNHFSKTNPYIVGENSYHSWLQYEKKNEDLVPQTQYGVLDELKQVYNSRSWRYTKPFRDFLKIIKKIKVNTNSSSFIKNGLSNVLIIIHFWELQHKKTMGGSSLHVFDLIRSLKHKYNFHILTPFNGIYRVCSYWETGEKIVNFNFTTSENSKDKLLNKKYSNMIRNIIDCYNIDIIHIHHMMGHYFDIKYIINNKQIKLFITLHDYYSICPRITKINDKNKYCGNPREEECTSCLTSFSNNDPYLAERNNIIAWKDIWNLLFSSANKIIVPSDAAKLEVKKTYNNLPIDVIEHGMDIVHEKNILNIDADNIFNVAFIGNLYVNKGMIIVEELIKYAHNYNDNIFLHLFGAIKSNFNQDKYNHFINHGEFEREHLNKMLKDYNIKLVCLFSIWPETYSYTLTESVSNNIPLFAIDEGAIGQRIRENKLGWLIKNGTDIPEIYQKIKDIFNNKNEYRNVSKSISEYKIKNLREMCSEYDNIYSNYKIVRNKSNSIKRIFIYFKSLILQLNLIFKNKYKKYKPVFNFSLSEELQVYDVTTKKISFGKQVYKCGKIDPQIYFPLDKPIDKPSTPAYLSLKYTSSLSGNLKIYYDFGSGFNESDNSGYIQIKRALISTSLKIPIENWLYGLNIIELRIDPPDNTDFLIKKIRILQEK